MQLEFKKSSHCLRQQTVIKTIKEVILMGPVKPVQEPKAVSQHMHACKHTLCVEEQAELQENRLLNATSDSPVTESVRACCICVT